MAPILKEQYAESQRLAALARKEASEKEYCKSNRSLIIARGGSSP
jgi:hypothetical protein